MAFLTTHTYSMYSFIDDGLCPKRFRSSFDSKKKLFPSGEVFIYLTSVILYFLFFLLAGISSCRFSGKPISPEVAAKNWTNEFNNFIQPLRSVNSYGLFRVMTKTRPEITIEGSTNGEDWKLYKFKWKPDHANDPLQFTGPHMPRIDWQMWFEGLRAERYVNQPFSRFLYGRFLDIIANGGGQKECFDLSKVLGGQEMRAFAQAPQQQKQIIVI